MAVWAAAPQPLGSSCRRACKPEAVQLDSVHLLRKFKFKFTSKLIPIISIFNVLSNISKLKFKKKQARLRCRCTCQSHYLALAAILNWSCRPGVTVFLVEVVILKLVSSMADYNNTKIWLLTITEEEMLCIVRIMFDLTVCPMNSIKEYSSTLEYSSTCSNSTSKIYCLRLDSPGPSMGSGHLVICAWTIITLYKVHSLVEALAFMYKLHFSPSLQNLTINTNDPQSYLKMLQPINNLAESAKPSPMRKV